MYPSEPDQEALVLYGMGVEIWRAAVLLRHPGPWSMTKSTRESSWEQVERMRDAFPEL